MYSGITQGLYKVVEVDKRPGLIRYTVELSPALLEGLKVSASVATEGVCQTVAAIDQNRVTFDLMQETLDVTTLSDLYVGRMVSVERSLRYGDENGGHEMAGHVIGTASVHAIKEVENNLTLTLKCPEAWMRYILPKGFIGVEGCSLTVGDTDPAGLFDIHLIPETLRLTNFGSKRIGDRVNVEVDARTQAIVETVERIVGEMKWANPLSQA